MPDWEAFGKMFAVEVAIVVVLVLLGLWAVWKAGRLSEYGEHPPSPTVERRRLMARHPVGRRWTPPTRVPGSSRPVPDLTPTQAMDIDRWETEMAEHD